MSFCGFEESVIPPMSQYYGIYISY